MLGWFRGGCRREETLNRMAQIRVTVDRSVQEMNDDLWAQHYMLGFGFNSIGFLLKSENNFKDLGDAGGLAVGECGAQLTGMAAEKYMRRVNRLCAERPVEFERGLDNGGTWACFAVGVARRGTPKVENIIESAKATKILDDQNDDDMVVAASYLFHRDLVEEARLLIAKMRSAA